MLVMNRVSWSLFFKKIDSDQCKATNFFLLVTGIAVKIEGKIESQDEVGKALLLLGCLLQ